MRAIIVLLLLGAATAKAQPSEGAQVPREESLPPPPIISAPPANANPEDEFITPSFPSAPAQDEAPAPPPPARPPKPSPPAQAAAAPAQQPPKMKTPFGSIDPTVPGPSMLQVVTVPIGAGALMLLTASRFTDDRSTLVNLTVATTGITLLSMVTAKLLMAPSGTRPEKPASSSLEAMPIPVVLSAGRDHQGLAAGPGLFLRF